MSLLSKVPAAGLLQAARSLVGSHAILGLQFSRTISSECGERSCTAKPGSTVNISTEGTNAIDIEPAVGSEAAVFEWSPSDAWSVNESPSEAAPGASSIDVRSLAGASGGHLTATLPDKWVNVNVACTAASPVRVGRLVEASLRVSSGGGGVALGSVRAHVADVDTAGAQASAGGALEGNELSASDVTLRTAGGALTLRRLVGQRVHVTTGGGPLSVAAVYAERVRVQTGGGSIDIGTLDCSEAEVSLHSGSGPITIRGLDGNAQLTSAGGPVAVQLNSRVGQVGISSGGGRVAVGVSPQAEVVVAVRNARSITADGQQQQGAGGGSSSGSDGSSCDLHFRAGQDDRAAARCGPASPGRVLLDAGGGDVEVRRLGWADALRSRLQQQRQQQ